MQIQTVSIRELHQPAIAVFGIRRIIHIILRILHVEPFPEAVDPAAVLPKGPCFLYNINHIIVLKDIPRHVGIGP